MPNPLASDLDEILGRTGDVWRALEGASIFITGGTGFYGSWLLESFAWAVRHGDLKADITVLSRSPEALTKYGPHLSEHPHIRLVRGDVRTFEFPNGPCTHIIHAATPATALAYRDQTELKSTIEDGTDHAIAYALHSGAQRFLMASSGAVYGPQPHNLDRMSEDHVPVGPWTTYGGSKLAAERAAVGAAELRPDFQPVIARGFAFVGPEVPHDFAASDFVENGLFLDVVRVRGDGSPVRSYLYASDLVEWLWRLLVFGQSRTIYNVGSDREISIRDLAFLVQAATGASEVRFAGSPDLSIAPERYVPDVSRIQNHLGVRQTVSLEDGLSRWIAWVRARYDARNVPPYR